MFYRNHKRKCAFSFSFDRMHLLHISYSEDGYIQVLNICKTVQCPLKSNRSCSFTNTPHKVCSIVRIHCRIAWALYVIFLMTARNIWYSFHVSYITCRLKILKANTAVN
uniref:Uncharacterized protein n=1 Tax=Schistocephalus solidus TaxID=70667 RepID=A0A0V0J4T5_SCHSO